MPRRKRREYGSGTIYQDKEGKWYASVRIKKSDGSPGRKKRVAKSKRHAEILLDTLLSEVEAEQGQPLQTGETVGDLIDRYFRDRCTDLAPASAAMNEYARSKLAELEHLPVSAVKPVDVANLLAKLSGLPGSRRKVKSLLSRAFDYAVDLEIVARNPCSGARLPRGVKTKAQVFSEDEVRKILRGIKGNRYEAYVWLLAHSGMRQQEAAGLRWGKVHMTGPNPHVVIDSVISEVRGKLYIKTTKTESSQRTVPLTPEVVERLAKLSRGKPDDLVFCTEKGGPISRSNFGNRTWRPLLRKLKIPVRGMHCLRHTVATTLLLRGAPITAVAGLLGHKNPSVLLSTYSHFVKGSEKIGADLMAGFGTGKQEKPREPIREPISPKNEESRRVMRSHDENKRLKTSHEES